MRRIVLALAVLALGATSACNKEPEDKPATTKSYFAKGGAQGAATAAAGGTGTAMGQPANGQGSGKLPPGHPPISGMMAKARQGAPTGGPAKMVAEGTITVAAKLKAKIPHGTLFLMGRMPGKGGQKGPPVLVLKVDNPTFPLKFKLTSDNTMMPGIPIPPTVELGAILDQDGDAVSRTPGDLAGEVKAPVKDGSKGVKLVLDTVDTVTKPGLDMGAMGGGGGMPAGHPSTGGGMPAGHPAVGGSK